jgi:outer membrane lipoprotein SlyB
MKKMMLATAVLAISALAPLAYAGDDDAKVTGLAGGAATGAVLGGPVGAVVGGAVGLTTGAAIDDQKEKENTKTVIIKQQQPDVVVHEEQPAVVIDDQ